MAIRLPKYAPRAAELWAEGLAVERILDKLAEEGIATILAATFGELRRRRPDLFPPRDQAARNKNISQSAKRRVQILGHEAPRRNRHG